MKGMEQIKTPDTKENIKKIVISSNNMNNNSIVNSKTIVSSKTKSNIKFNFSNMKNSNFTNTDIIKSAYSQKVSKELLNRKVSEIKKNFMNSSSPKNRKPSFKYSTKASIVNKYKQDNSDKKENEDNDDYYINSKKKTKDINKEEFSKNISKNDNYNFILSKKSTSMNSNNTVQKLKTNLTSNSFLQLNHFNSNNSLSNDAETMKITNFKYNKDNIDNIDNIDNKDNKASSSINKTSTLQRTITNTFVINSEDTKINNNSKNYRLSSSVNNLSSFHRTVTTTFNLDKNDNDNIINNANKVDTFNNNEENYFSYTSSKEEVNSEYQDEKKISFKINTNKCFLVPINQYKIKTKDNTFNNNFAIKKKEEEEDEIKIDYDFELERLEESIKEKEKSLEAMIKV